MALPFVSAAARLAPKWLLLELSALGDDFLQIACSLE
jgi:hypothetical protein